MRQHPDFPRRWLRLSEATDDFIHAGVGSAKSCDYTLEGGTHYIQKPTGKIPWSEYWLRFKTARRKTYTIQYNSRVLFRGWRQWMSLILWAPRHTLRYPGWHERMQKLGREVKFSKHLTIKKKKQFLTSFKNCSGSIPIRCFLHNYRFHCKIP